MKYERVYPVPCPDCDAEVGVPCDSPNGLTHLSRLRSQLINIQLKALEARRSLGRDS